MEDKKKKGHIEEKEEYFSNDPATTPSAARSTVSNVA